MSTPFHHMAVVNTASARMATSGPLVFWQPGALDMLIYRGDSGRTQINFSDPSEDPIDLTGATWKCVIRETADSPDVLATLGVEPVVDMPGAIELVLAAAESSDLDSNGVWDLEMTLDGDTRTMLAGRMILQRDVSR